MKTNEIISEGIFDTIKSKYRGAMLDFTGTTQQIAARNAKENMIKNLLTSIQQQVSAGYVDLNLPAIQRDKSGELGRSADLRKFVDEKLRDLRTQTNKKSKIKTIKKLINTFSSEKEKNPSWKDAVGAVREIIRRSNYLDDASKKSFIKALTSGVTVSESDLKYTELNNLFESILQSIGQNPISLYEYLKQYTASLLPGISEEELNRIKTVLLQVQNSWNNPSEKNKAINKWADSVIALSKNRQLQFSRGNTTNITQSTQTQPTQNPQQQYTDTLNKQIERMTTDYKDDIPKIIDALVTRLQQIDPNGYKQVIDTIKALPSGATASPVPAPVTENKRYHKNNVFR